jgi:O-antigen ligase
VLYSPAPIDGAKQAVLIAVPFVMAAVAYDAARSDPETQPAVQRYVLASARVLLVFLAVLASTGALGMTEIGLGSSIGARNIAFYSLPVLSLTLAMWRHGDNAREKSRGKWYSLVLVAVVVATLSRTASAIALGLLLPFRFIGAGWRRGVLAVAAGVVLFVSAVLLIAPLGRRFFLDQPGSLPEVAVAEGINTMGRSTMWAITWTGALERPVFGHGAGAVRQLMQTTLELDHPHNDYLKVLYDSGAVGLAALVLGCLMAIARYGRYWKHADERGERESAKYHMTAFLAAISFTGSLLTDNVLVYTFVTIPTFVLMGISVARANEA